MAKKTKKLTTFKSSETVVTDEYLNSLYGGLHGTDKEQFYSTLDPLVSGHVHDGEHADGHAQKIDLSKHVTGKLPKEFVSGTFDYFLNVSIGSKTIVADQPNDTLNVAAGDYIVLDANETTDTLIISSDIKPDAPNLSFQFNSADTFAGSETFIFNAIDRSIQLSKDTAFRFGSIDSEYTYTISHSYFPSPDPPNPALNFFIPNTTESYVTFSNFDFFQSSSKLFIRTDKESMYVYPTNSVYDGDTSTTIDSQLGYDDGSVTILPWADVNSEELTLWNIAFNGRPSKTINYANSRYVALRTNSDQQDNYTIYMPKYMAGTVNNILRVSSIPSSTEVEMTWDSISNVLGTTSFNNPGRIYSLAYYDEHCTTTLSQTTTKSTCDMSAANRIGVYYVPEAAQGGSLQIGRVLTSAGSKLYVNSIFGNAIYGTTVDAILSYGTTHFNGNFFVNTTSEFNIFHSYLKQQTTDTSILENSLFITNNYTSYTTEDMPELKAEGSDSAISMRFTVHGAGQAPDDSYSHLYYHDIFPSYRFAPDSEDPSVIRLYTRDMTTDETTSFVGIMPPIFDHLQENYILVLPDHVPATDDYVLTAKLADNYGSSHSDPFINLQWEPRCCDTADASPSVGLINNIQTSNGSGGFQSTDWVITEGNNLLPGSQFYNIGTFDAQVERTFVRRNSTTTAFNDLPGVVFSDSSTTQLVDSDVIYSSNGNFVFYNSQTIDLDSQVSQSFVLGGKNNESVNLTFSSGKGNFHLKTNRNSFEDQVLELPETKGVEGNVLVIDTVENNTIRTSWNSTLGGTYRFDNVVSGDVSTVASHDNTNYLVSVGTLAATVNENSFTENYSVESLEQKGFYNFDSFTYLADPDSKVIGTVNIVIGPSSPSDQSYIDLLKLAYKGSEFVLKNSSTTRSMNFVPAFAANYSLAQTVDFKRNLEFSSQLINTVDGIASGDSASIFTIPPQGSERFKLRMPSIGLTANSRIIFVYKIS